MLRQRHHHLHAVVAPTTTTTSPAAPDLIRTSSTPAACRSSQQAAAAWAWFEHGGSSCITPSKAEGLVAAQRRAKHIFTKPSRFRIEVLGTRQTPQKGSAESAITEDGRCRHRRHSFHDNRISDMDWRFSSSCRKAPGSPCFNFDVDGTIGDQNEAENEFKGTGPDSSCQDAEGSSLLDKFEIEAVRRQLHEQLISGRISPSCSSPCSSATCRRMEPVHEDHKSHKAQHDHHQHHNAHLKPRRSFKSSDAAAGHRQVADTEHHHHINNMVHRLLHLRMKTSTSGRSISSALAPAICNSIATANSIVDHHHGQSPKHHKATSPVINQTAKRQHAALHNWSSMQKVVHGVSAAADAKHERQDYTLKHSHKSHPKEVPRRRGHDLIGDGMSSTTPSSLHHSDSKISKALLPMVSALALGDHKHGAKSWRDDGALAALQGLSNRHSHLTSEHHHIHHHHHHYYHHLEHTNEASKGARVQHFLQKGDAGDHVLQGPNLYKLLKEAELVIPAADHGEGPAQPRDYVAAQNLLSRQYASGIKLQKL